MARDYKNRAAPAARPKAKSRPAARWPFFVAGLLLGAGSVGFAWYRLVPPGTPMNWPQIDGSELSLVDSKPPTLIEENGDDNGTDEAEDNGLRFEFFTILPEREVVVSDDELRSEPRPAPRPANSAASPASKPAASTPVRRERYLLQVGSFRRLADADRLKAQLALLGLEADIQSVKVRPGETYHRVRTGPYRDKRTLSRYRDQLKQNGITSLVVRLRD